MIDLIIPTMWKFEKFPHFLEQYKSYSNINKIIIINNNLDKTPVDLVRDNKIFYYNSNINLFVGPSWNIGVSLSSSNIICILNDDVNLSSKVIDFILHQDFSEIDIVGANIVNEEIPLNLEKIIIDRSVELGMQYCNFGTCMFMEKKKYKIIPSLYKCWYTDDYLVHQLKNIYRVPIFFKEYSEYGNSNTIRKLPEISEIIQNDIDNATKYLLKNE